MTRLRIGVLGAGFWAGPHLEAIATLPDAEVVGLADLDPARAEEVAQRHGVAAWFTDPIALLEATAPDAVVVVTPSPTHAALTTACAERGIAVLVEKPACRPGEEQALLRAAEQVPVMPGHVLRFGAPYVALAEAAADPARGPVTGLVAQRHRGVDHITSYPETHVVDLTMVHDIDLALWILASPVVQVRGWCGLPSDGFPALVPGAPPTLAQAELTTADGRVALLRASWLLPTGGGHDLLVAHDGRGKVHRIGAPGPGVAGLDIDQAMAAEWTHFADCVRHGRQPTRVTVADALDGLAIAEAIKISAAADGAAVPVRRAAR